MPPAKETRNPFLADDESEVQPPQNLKEYAYQLKPWLTLALLGLENTADNSKNVPIILDGQAVTGEVRLDLGSRGDAGSIRAISISIRGRIITGAAPSEMVTSLEIPSTLWTRTPTTKLKGQHVLPFSMTLPPSVSLPSFGGQKEEFRLPPSFYERHTRAQVEYDVTVHLTRKMRPDYRLSTVINYMPVSRPGPPSGLRQLAYQQHVPLPGPDSDPEGWRTSHFVKTQGRLTSTSRLVEARCNLSLATPLCYTRGTTIPCAIVIESSDPHTLDLLSFPDSIALRLRRNVRFHSGEKNPTHYTELAKLVWKEELDHSELASWRPAAEKVLDSDAIAMYAHRRTLKGEIHLRSDLIPSAAMAHFRIEYSVVLFPFDAPDYESLDGEPLIMEPVEIASDYPDAL
ncbi:hypothetical protein FB45DRAFT_886947 [Roridomyces roridus]|uniref:Arrestin-like N-terminal domain-containing protein n=1 Tax=Roridomyces roridus TaxID=1738132 RepID=A0AAD7CIJ5_9AGAR|nr:hypothetical protein FB45DRAFT_886947 [Roridomyces roridus]